VQGNECEARHVQAEEPSIKRAKYWGKYPPGAAGATAAEGGVFSLRDPRAFFPEAAVSSRSTTHYKRRIQAHW